MSARGRIATRFPSPMCSRTGATSPDAAIDAAAAAIDPKDVAYILYTSGSTSTPKGVQLQHYALIENMWHIGDRMHVTEHDRLWLAVSLFWGLGCENALFNLMTHGGCVVLQESFEPGEALRIIERERCTIFYGMPNMVQAIAEHPDRRDYDICGDARRRHARHARAVAAHRRSRRDEILDDLRADRDPTAIAPWRTGTTVRVRSPTVGPSAARRRPAHRSIPRPASEQPRGTVGEIRLKGYVTIGYYKDADKNREAFDARRLFPHRRSRLPRRGRLSAISAAGQGNDQDRRHQCRAGRGRGEPAALSGREARFRHRRARRACATR